MSWIADLHIHSHFSMATSKECNPFNLYKWAGLKGVSLVGTGDFTHPGWRAELRKELVSAEPGFYRLAECPHRLIPDQPETRFVVSGEISTIYKKNGRTRKVHHLIVLPSIEHADRISNRLEELGMNIRSDGRPILGLDSRRLLELVLENCPETIFIPAHIWTPHFSVFGSNSGFEMIEECYEDLTPHIFALETGLSSDPAMNWRWSALDRFALVSNSDAHNPQNLAREANIFDGEFSYCGMRDALQKKNQNFSGTLEFFPEEGKYHYDGHRNCEVCWKPEETIAAAGMCPVCGRKVTVGVLHRIWELADRPEGYRPTGTKPFQNLVPLRQIIAAAVKSSVSSRKVEQLYMELLPKLGPELGVLRDFPVEDIAKASNALVAEAVRRLRQGNVEVKPGYDGEYGVIAILREDDRQALLGQASLLEQDTLPAQGALPERPAFLGKKVILETREIGTGTLSQYADGKTGLKRPVETGTVKKEKAVFELTPEQRAIVRSVCPVTLVVAGPGTGKTRTLVERIFYLIREKAVLPAEITAVTFTNKAAAEVRNRLSIVLGESVTKRLAIGTFHGLAWRILNQNPEPPAIQLLDAFQAKEIIGEVLRQKRIPMTAREAVLTITVHKNRYRWQDESNLATQVVELLESYQNSLISYGRWDYDDILIQALALWENNPVWLQPLKQQFQHLLIDEFQDLNSIQFELTKHWAAGKQSLFVIGDPNQAIYGFRGASNQFLDRLQREYPEAALFQLTRNHRATVSLVEAANHLVPDNYRQQSVPSPTDDPQPTRVRASVFWCAAPTEKAAVKALVDEIVQLLGGSTMLSAHGSGKRKRLATSANVDVATFSFNDFAVLYRTGRQVELLENALAAEGLPYRVAGQEPTHEATVVQEFLTFFRYLGKPSDIFNFRSVLAFPVWGFTKDEIAFLSEQLKKPTGEATLDQLLFLQERLRHLPEEHLKVECCSKLNRLAEIAAHYLRFLEFPVAKVIGEWKLRLNPAETEIIERLVKLGENHPTLGAFLDFLPLATEADLIRKGNRTSGAETITLSTLHAAKGLEFPVVFIYGVEEGLLPMGNNPDQAVVAEEQRLFYVGVTRARQSLYLVNIQNRYRNDQRVPTEPSRYLKLLPEPLVTKLNWDRFAEKDKQLGLF